jgi:hypothetical protein
VTIPIEHQHWRMGTVRARAKPSRKYGPETPEQSFGFVDRSRWKHRNFHNNPMDVDCTNRIGNKTRKFVAIGR